jgi:hypothetical protein
MAEIYNSTNRKSIDTNPNTPRLIHEDTVTMSGFTSFDGGFIAQAAIDITNFNQVKDVWQQIGPVSLKAEVMHVVPDGGEFTWFNIAPFYKRYDNSGLKTRWCTVDILNQTNTGDDTFVSQLLIDYYTTSNSSGDKFSSFYTQEFRYKIWSTLF